MKLPLFLFLILFSVIVSPALCESADTDLESIRKIVNEIVNASEKRLTEKIDKISEDIEGLDTRLRNVEKDVASLSGRIDGIDNLITWLLVIIVAVFGIPQLVVLWRNRTDERELKNQVEILTREIEELKTKGTVSS